MRENIGVRQNKCERVYKSEEEHGTKQKFRKTKIANDHENYFLNGTKGHTIILYIVVEWLIKATATTIAHSDSSCCNSASTTQ